jgi:FkbM family methyltransferase
MGQGLSQGWSAEVLRKPGFRPATVIDVGAGYGTPALYEAFPAAHLVLIEPLRECAHELERWLDTYEGERIETAIGSEKTNTILRVDRESPWLSSIPPRLHAPPGSSEPEERIVPVTTLDRLYDERGWKGPLGLKIDSEGYEMKVIEGATELLGKTQFIVAEVSVRPRFEGGYTFAEFIAFMHERRFALCDLVDGLKARPDSTAEYLDVLFRRA